MLSSTAPPVALLPLPEEAVAIVGLLWRPLPHKGVKKAAHQLLQNAGGGSLVIHRHEQQAQCGIAPPLPSGPQYYSAALLLMATLGDDWVGIFEWQQGQYLLFGVSDGQIVPGCDGLFDSVAAVTAQFERYQFLCDWSVRYAPAHLNLGGDPLDINPLLNSNPPPQYRLQTTYNSPKNRTRLRLGVILCLGVLTLGYFICRYHEKEQALLQLAQQQLLLQTKKQYQQHKEQGEAVWRKQPAARVVLQHCVQRLSQYPLLLGGWQLIEGHCTPQGSTAIYQRTLSSPAQNFVQAATAHYPNTTPLQNDDKAQIQQPSCLQARGEEKLQPLSTLFNQLINYRERGVATVRVKDNLAVATSKKSTPFELSCQQSPLQLFHLAELNGMVIQQVKSTINTNSSLTWSLHGTLYGQ